MENHGQTLRVIIHDKDRNLTIACTSKYAEQENDNEKWYLYQYVSKTRRKKFCRKFFFLQIFCKLKLLEVQFHETRYFYGLHFIWKTSWKHLERKKKMKAYRKTYKSTSQ